MSSSDDPRWKYAHGVMWFLIWIGLGGCCYLANRKGPIIEITTLPAEVSK